MTRPLAKACAALGAFALPLSLSLIAALPAAAQEPFETLIPENADARAFQEAVGYSEAVIVGDMVYLSGIIAAPAPGDEGMEPGFTRAFDHIGSILKRAGVDWGDVVLFDTFHTDIAAQITPFVTVKNRYIKAPFPAWTAVEVSGLYEPEGLVEIKVAARRQRGNAE
ncbi:hypothetical protein KCG44_13970 [Pacificimonas sp. WHA3]|uniref:Uncharacterized protein n=1 Tax=Pacificimonas pallii TaxID=2827236 RepID=A0ABS6SHI4_9SPHN|nr:Rid family hydrolase [Pacificimonas pallii]MBV7257888.1 hypothetical protein [Pacificimonas pallii]